MSLYPLSCLSSVTYFSLSFFSFSLHFFASQFLYFLSVFGALFVYILCFFISHFSISFHIYFFHPCLYFIFFNIFQFCVVFNFAAHFVHHFSSFTLFFYPCLSVLSLQYGSSFCFLSLTLLHISFTISLRSLIYFVSIYFPSTVPT